MRVGGQRRGPNMGAVGREQDNPKTPKWTCSEISRKFRLLRKSATILNDVK